MAGIYLHIPFCKAKCHYCNFFSLATTKYRKEFHAALLMEISQRKEYLKGQTVDSIYFGGGTPSLLSIGELNEIFEHISQNYKLNDQLEVTLEANPDDLKADFLEGLNNTMVNRLSIGIQSFHDEELHYVNRVHSGQEAINSVKMAQDKGFDNLSLDLIYGIPVSSIERWQENLQILEELKPTHLSAYSLTQEAKTAYDVLVKKGKLQAPNDEKAIEQYELLQSFLPLIQMEQYEISNYASQGKYAVHNTNYWRGIPYLGFGPSAHSYNGKSRGWNISNLTQYIQSVEKGAVLAEQEILSQSNQWNEFVMTGLRTKWGVCLTDLRPRFPVPWIAIFKEKAKQFVEKQWMKEENDTYTLTSKGKLFADGIAVEFFVG